MFSTHCEFVHRTQLTTRPKCKDALILDLVGSGECECSILIPRIVPLINSCHKKLGVITKKKKPDYFSKSNPSWKVALNTLGLDWQQLKWIPSARCLLAAITDIWWTTQWWFLLLYKKVKMKFHTAALSCSRTRCSLSLSAPIKFHPTLLKLFTSCSGKEKKGP